METLKEKTTKGMFWSALSNGTIQIFGLVIGIFLARLLSIADYGLVGVLSIFTLLAGNLQSSGFTQALINIKQPSFTEYNSVFWFNITAGAVLYGVLFLCAPLIAFFFHQPALIDLSRLLFLCIPISSLGIVPAAYMAKNMMNRETAIINLWALSLSGIVSITMAFNGWAYWSMAWQQLLYISFMTAGRYYYSAWRPSFHIDYRPVKNMFGFSVKILLTNMLNTLSGNILTFVFGRLFSIGHVGNFTQANKWSTMASGFVTGTLGQVAQTVLVAADDEVERERRIFRKMMRFTAFLSFPVMFGLSLVSQEFIVIAIGEKWQASVELLQVLAIACAFIPFQSMFQNLAISKGRSDIYLWCNVAQLASLLAIIFAFRPLGFYAMIIGYSIFTILWLLVWQQVGKRLIGLRLVDTVRDISPFLLTSVVVMTVTYWTTCSIQHRVLLLLVRVPLAAVLYFAIMHIARIDIMTESIALLKSKRFKSE